MIYRLVAAAALPLLLALPTMASAQDLASQLVGVWKRNSQVSKVLATGEMTKPMGENPTGTAVFTRGGHFFWIFIAD